jgi:tetratricopeptide (TPR) repeat protein
VTRGHRLGPDEWTRLEALWDTARELSPDQRDKFLASHEVDDVLREELEALLARASAAEVFFDRLRAVVSQAAPTTVQPDLDGHAHDEAATAALTSARTAADPMIGATVAHYQIVERLGEGGMGVVYRAIDLRLRRAVALKLLRTHTPRDPRAKERLLGEARAAAALDHPNICTIYEVGETAAQVPFIAMAFYRGETLQQVIGRGPLPHPTALDYATQVARGLGVAHQRGIVHRDVKPANIVVTADGVVKLLDFGIARVLDVSASHDGVTPGTIAYMSPEQASSRPVDQRTDLWSLGVVLYEMCTGVRPFGGDHAAEVVHAILHQSPPEPAALRREIPPHVESILGRLLAKDPEQRYGNADELISDLVSTSHSPTRATGAARRRLLRRAAWYGAGLLALGIAAASWPGAKAPPLSERRIAARDLYGQGNRDVLYRTERGRRQSLEFFRQALAVDPTYATAHAGLAHLLVLTADDSGASRRAHLLAANDAARTAIRLDSLLADAHAALGDVLLADYQLGRAEGEFKKAAALDPGMPYVHEFLVWLYIFMNRPRDALQEAERATAADPNSPTAIAEHARALLVNGRCSEALALLGRLAYLQPPPARAAGIAAQCYGRQQMWQKAVEELRPSAQRNPLRGAPLLGFMLARAGETERARQLADTLLEQWRQGNGGAFGLAVIYAGLRDFDSAFAWLDKSVEDRSLRYNIMEPAFEELHRDPRFDHLRQRLGIRR